VYNSGNNFNKGNCILLEVWWRIGAKEEKRKNGDSYVKTWSNVETLERYGEK
jgi:hypothetical protein